MGVGLLRGLVGFGVFRYFGLLGLVLLTFGLWVLVGGAVIGSVLFWILGSSSFKVLRLFWIFLILVFGFAWYFGLVGFYGYSRCLVVLIL